MPIWESILIFSFFTLAGFGFFYGVRPYLETRGFSEMYAYLIPITSVFVIMVLWSLIAFWRENGRMEWGALVKRFRLDRLNWKIVLISVGISVLTLGSEVTFSPMLSSMIENGLIKIPASIPAYLNPIEQMALGEIKAQFLAEGVFWLLPIALLFNILGEELLWRGYMLPRQEVTHGKYTWLLHGFLWAFSHTFQYWLLPPILLTTLVLSYMAQKQKTTWIGIIAHGINNSLPIIALAFL
jgi:membrane protease YdiL (CAAX protease family)